MSRLPNIGSDINNWGTILNDFLLVSHNSDGTIRPSALISGTSNVPVPIAVNETIVSNASNQWTLANAASIEVSLNPVADTFSGTVGSNFTVSSSNHSHPINTLGRAVMMGGAPLNFNNNVNWTFDGVWTGSISVSDVYGGTIGPYFNNNPSVFATLSGNNYTMASQISSARNIVVASGVTLLPHSYTTNGGGIIMWASESITINGTIDCSGPSASGATGGAGVGNGVGGYAGAAGATGTTGVGARGFGYNGGCGSLGGQSGGGGSAGNGTGGGASSGVSPTNFGIGMFGQLWLLGGYSFGNPNSFSFGSTCQSGGGGGAGGGDGVNNGGGGGAGGATILLIAPQIILGPGSLLKATGGNGANGLGGNAGGGGGGGGGAVALNALNFSISPSALINTSGGSPGLGVGTGNNGASGSAATLSFQDPIPAAGGYGYGAGVLIQRWQ